jgi:lipopolysaccharide/colanic/teichoic acid biosynthesis glycosyltransferase
MNSLICKRIFDFSFALLLSILVLPLMLLLFLIATINMRGRGLFLQKRIGQHGTPFTILKFRTLDPKYQESNLIGAFFRRHKLDEFPQLFNIIMGQMSFVGPRPDLPGYYDLLQGENRKILELKPGITSAASLKYYNEQYLLFHHSDPFRYNDEVIFPNKVKMNLNYYYTRTFVGDLQLMWSTLFRASTRLPILL